MHSSEVLTSASFEIVMNERKAMLSDVFPNLEERDRLGVVVREPGGGFGASTLILATITAFYDLQRAQRSDFFIYPDYFAFHLGQRFADHGMLDIFPDHKEVVVADDPEEVLRAINDRAITRLLVADGGGGIPTFTRETLASTQIRTAVAYSPSGRVTGADITVTGCAASETFVAAALERSSTITPIAADRIRGVRKGLLENGVPVESFRRVDVAEALDTLAVRSPANLSNR